MGVASTLRKWGYVKVAKKKKTALSQRPDNIYLLGLCPQKFVRSVESVEAAVGQLLAARSAVQEEWSELLQGGTPS